MLKAVLDTNILVSGILWKNGLQAKLLQLARLGKFETILSLDIVAELRDVLLRPKFKLTEKEVDAVIKELLKFCRIVLPKIKLNIVQDDPKDNMVLEAAISSQTDYVISGDKHLLDLRSFKNIKIVTTAEFFDVLLKQA